jgi:hypothetical protein
MDNQTTLTQNAAKLQAPTVDLAAYAPRDARQSHIRNTDVESLHPIIHAVTIQTVMAL